MHSIYVYTDIYQRAQNFCKQLYIYAQRLQGQNMRMSLCHSQFSGHHFHLLLITRAMRHRVFKWVQFVYLSSVFFLVCRFCTLDTDWFAAWWHILCCRWSHVKYSGQLKNEVLTGDVCFACLSFGCSLTLWTVCWNAHITYKHIHWLLLVDPH